MAEVEEYGHSSLPVVHDVAGAFVGYVRMPVALVAIDVSDHDGPRHDPETEFNIVEAFFKVVPEIFSLSEFFRKYRGLRFINKDRGTGGSDVRHEELTGSQELF